MDMRGKNMEIDLESGPNTNVKDGVKDPAFSGEGGNKLLSRVWSGVIRYDGSTRGKDGLNLHRKVLSCGEISEVLSEKLEKDIENLLEMQMVNEKLTRSKVKRPSKPPRPPRGPSLDATDLKLVHEISELATLKRRRVEGMKSLRKMKADKGSRSSFNINLFAMAVTFIFFLVIICQGLMGSHISGI